MDYLNNLTKGDTVLNPNISHIDLWTLGAHKKLNEDEWSDPDKVRNYNKLMESCYYSKLIPDKEQYNEYLNEVWEQNKQGSELNEGFLQTFGGTWSGGQLPSSYSEGKWWGVSPFAWIKGPFGWIIGLAFAALGLLLATIMKVLGAIARTAIITALMSYLNRVVRLADHGWKNKAHKTSLLTMERGARTSILTAACKMARAAGLNPPKLTEAIESGDDELLNEAIKEFENNVLNEAKPTPQQIKDASDNYDISDISLPDDKNVDWTLMQPIRDRWLWGLIKGKKRTDPWKDVYSTPDLYQEALKGPDFSGRNHYINGLAQVMKSAIDVVYGQQISSQLNLTNMQFTYQIAGAGVRSQKKNSQENKLNPNVVKNLNNVNRNDYYMYDSWYTDLKDKLFEGTNNSFKLSAVIDLMKYYLQLENSYLSDIKEFKKEISTNFQNNFDNFNNNNTIFLDVSNGNGTETILDFVQLNNCFLNNLNLNPETLENIKKYNYDFLKKVKVNKVDHYLNDFIINHNNIDKIKFINFKGEDSSSSVETYIGKLSNLKNLLRYNQNNQEKGNKNFFISFSEKLNKNLSLAVERSNSFEILKEADNQMKNAIESLNKSMVEMIDRLVTKSCEGEKGIKLKTFLVSPKQRGNGITLMWESKCKPELEKCRINRLNNIATSPELNYFRTMIIVCAFCIEKVMTGQVHRWTNNNLNWMSGVQNQIDSGKIANAQSKETPMSANNASRQ